MDKIPTKESRYNEPEHIPAAEQLFDLQRGLFVVPAGRWFVAYPPSAILSAPPQLKLPTKLKPRKVTKAKGAKKK